MNNIHAIPVTIDEKQKIGMRFYCVICQRINATKCHASRLNDNQIITHHTKELSGKKIRTGLLAKQGRYTFICGKRSMYSVEILI